MLNVKDFGISLIEYIDEEVDASPLNVYDIYDVFDSTFERVESFNAFLVASYNRDTSRTSFKIFSNEPLNDIVEIFGKSHFSIFYINDKSNVTETHIFDIINGVLEKDKVVCLYTNGKKKLLAKQSQDIFQTNNLIREGNKI